MISCLIVNFNCLQHTKNLVADLEAQNFQGFELIIVDQNSQEAGTKDFLDAMQSKYIVVQNGYNKPLNHIWNWFAKVAQYDFCAFLNNDIRIPKNFLSDTVNIFMKEPDVACVVHPTNHPDWQIARKKLDYVVLDERVRQGWDFSYRRAYWTPIPEILDFYCGDDFVFENTYLNNRKVAMALSSPIIHLLSQTRRSPLNRVIPNRNPNKDIENYRALGFTHNLGLIDKYSKVAPEIVSLKQEM